MILWVEICQTRWANDELRDEWFIDIMQLGTLIMNDNALFDYIGGDDGP